MTARDLTILLSQRLSAGRVEPISLPLVPEIKLYLINQDFPQHELSRDEMMAMMSSPTYWVFCWASGQVLSRFIIDQPQWVSGKKVVDFGCGSGVAAIAAAKAGARQVIACDIDSEALLATRVNAALNGVEIELCEDFFLLPDDIDLIVVADVLYDRENLSWLEVFLQRSTRVLLADSRIKNFSAPGYHLLSVANASTVPDLDESNEFRSVRIYEGNTGVV